MNRLREVRFFKRVTQPLLALKTGIPQSRISLIENELVTPKEEEKRKLCKILRVTRRNLFS